MHPPLKRIWFVLPVFWLLLQFPATSAAERFPAYDVIRPNVDFWINIYTAYTTNQSLVHDSEDLSIIYDVIDLVPSVSPSASKINRRRMKRAKAKYERILRRLAADPGNGDPACRRVARLFGANATSKTFREARHRVRCQVGQSDRFKTGLIRSGAYIEKFRAIFKAQDLPEELAYLPHVESSFNVKAYSKFGAAGVWQFTRSTGKRFMKVGYVLDERRDPVLATHAAASLLKENFDKLNSWPLAITAYNHGAAGMARAKQSLGDYPAIFRSYRSRTFKFASRNFYPEFLAAREVARNYRAYFGDLEMDRPAQFQIVPLDGYADLQRLCDHYKVPVHVARELNPALRPPVFNGQKRVPRGYPLRLPAELNVASVPADAYHAVQKPSRFYTVQRGDTAGRIARTQGVRLTDLILANNLDRRARIYPRQTLRIPLPGESLPHALAAAPAEPREYKLLAKNEKATPLVAEPLSKPGTDASATRVAVASETSPEAGSAAAETANAGIGRPANDVIADTGSVEPPDEAIAEADERRTTGEEIAETGDGRPTDVETADAGNAISPDEAIAEADERRTTGEEIAETGDGRTADVETADAGNAISPDEAIAEADERRTTGEKTAETGHGKPADVETADAGNAISPDEAIAGADDGQPPSMEVVAADVRFEKVIDGARRPVGIIRAEVEETLGHYAEWAGVRTQQIRRLNGLAFRQTLRLHQKIKIPLARTTAREFEVSRYEYHKRLQEDFFTAYRISELQPYRVMNGDNLWSLCLEKFDIPMWLLKNCNPEVDFAALHLRQQLMVPTIEKSGEGAGDPSEEAEPGHAQTIPGLIERASL